MNSSGKRRLASESLAKLLVLVGAGVILLGCGTGSSTPTTTSSSSPSTTSTQATTTTSPTTTTAALQACSTDVLTASAVSGGIAAGTGYEIFKLANGGPSRCYVSGYVDLAFFGPSAAGGAGTGSRINVTVSETGTTGAQVKLSAHDTASFSMRYSNEPVGGAGCDTVASAEISLPSQTQTLSFPVSLTICGSVQIGPLGPPGTQTP
jgi:hypothetical protein